MPRHFVTDRQTDRLVLTRSCYYKVQVDAILVGKFTSLVLMTCNQTLIIYWRKVFCLFYETLFCFSGFAPFSKAPAVRRKGTRRCFISSSTSPSSSSGFPYGFSHYLVSLFFSREELLFILWFFYFLFIIKFVFEKDVKEDTDGAEEKKKINFWVISWLLESCWLLTGLKENKQTLKRVCLSYNLSLCLCWFHNLFSRN